MCAAPCLPTRVARRVRWPIKMRSGIDVVGSSDWLAVGGPLAPGPATCMSTSTDRASGCLSPVLLPRPTLPPKESALASGAAAAFTNGDGRGSVLHSLQPPQPLRWTSHAVLLVCVVRRSSSRLWRTCHLEDRH